jgi:hypothetical protein
MMAATQTEAPRLCHLGTPKYSSALPGRYVVSIQDQRNAQPGLVIHKELSRALATP